MEPQTVPHNRPDTPGIRPLPHTALLWLSIFDAFLALGMVLLFGKMAYEGFKAGEMGFMVGVLMTAGIIFPLTWLIIKTVIAVGIYRGRRWSLVLAVVFTCIGAFLGLAAIGLDARVFLVVMLFHLLMLFLEIKCLKLPVFKKA